MIELDGNLKFGSVQQNKSQNIDPNTTTLAYRPITAGKADRFLSVLVLYCLAKRPVDIVDDIKLAIKRSGAFITFVGGVRVVIESDGVWSVKRQSASKEVTMKLWRILLVFVVV